MIAAIIVEWRSRPGEARRAMATLFVLCGIVAVANLPMSRAATGRTITVQLLQPATQFSRKYDRDTVATQLATLARLGANSQADLVLAPETALPATWTAISSAPRAVLADAVRRSAADWRIGGFEISDEGLPVNAVLRLSAASALAQPQAVYHKRHLVPFAEYTPYGLGWFTSLLGLPMSERAALAAARYGLDGSAIRVAHTICLDLLYPLSGSDVASGAGIIVNHSNFAWVGSAQVREQFLNAARTRALEYDKPVAIAANDGPTVAIDRHGRVIARLASRESGSLIARLEDSPGRTLYATLGDLPFLLVGLALAGWAVITGRGG